MRPDKETLNELRIDRKVPEPKSSWLWIPVVLIVLGAIAVPAAAWLRRPGAVEVTTFTVRENATGAGAKTLLNASGYVTARRSATVSSKVPGKVTEVLIEEGVKVADNQVLARLDDSNLQTSVRLAEAQLASAKASLEETRALMRQAEAEYGRTIKLATNRIASPSDLDRAESDFKSLAARLQRQEVDVTVAEREVEVWKQQIEDMVIRAPFGGVVVAKNAQPGEMISPISAGGGFTRTGIATIVDMASLEIEIDVNESYLHRVSAGQPVEATLDAYPDWKIPCKVIAIIPTADRQKATVKVRVGFDKLDPRILPDMGVKVAFQGGPDSVGTRVSVMTIPASAVREQDGRKYVFVTRDGKVERRAVGVEGVLNDEARITSGLTGGEIVVATGPEKMVDGDRVKETKP